MGGRADSRSISTSLGHPHDSHTELMSSRDWPAFLCPVGTKPITMSMSGPGQAQPHSAGLAQPSPSQVDPWSKSGLHC